MPLSCKSMIKYNTKQREKILELFIDGSLLTAKAISNTLSDIDRTTVYRTLNTLVKQGTLREVHLHKEYAHYELINEGDNHQHFVCTNCDKVVPIEVDEKVIKKLLPENLESKEFELNIKGTCNDCR
jgi:Fur family transcriptional regulator, ferric uptake regulator